MKLPFDYDFFEALHEGVYVVNTQREILLWNKGAERITGYNAAEVAGRHCGDNILCHINASGGQMCNSVCPLLKTIQSRLSQSVNAYLHHKEGHRVAVNITSMPYFSEDGQVAGAIEIFTNRNEQLFDVEKIRELAKLSYTDPATGLYNQRYIENKLVQLLSQSVEKTSVGVLLFHLTMDHNKDKELSKILHRDFIQLIAKTLLSYTHAQVYCGRYQDDEFILIGEGLEKGQLLLISNKLLTLIKQGFITIEGTNFSPNINISGLIQARQESFRSIYIRLNSRMEEARKSGPYGIRID